MLFTDHDVIGTFTCANSTCSKKALIQESNIQFNILNCFSLVFKNKVCKWNEVEASYIRNHLNKKLLSPGKLLKAPTFAVAASVRSVGQSSPHLSLQGINK